MFPFMERNEMSLKYIKLLNMFLYFSIIIFTDIIHLYNVFLNIYKYNIHSSKQISVQALLHITGCLQRSRQVLLTTRNIHFIEHHII